MRSCIFLTLILCLSSCSNSSRPQVSEDQGLVTYSYQDEDSASTDAKNFQLVCNVQPCPQNMGSYLAHMSKTDLGICTFSLISEDTVITNRHCIPPDLAQEGVSCDGRIEFIFYNDATPDKKEIYQCGKILHLPHEYVAKDTEVDNQLSRDFAILQMKEKTTRPPLKLSAIGVPDATPLKAFVSTPNADLTKTIGAHIEVLNCTSVMNSLFVGSYSSATSPLIAVKNCPITHGNSGSALIDSNNQVRAILQSFVDIKTNPFHFMQPMSPQFLAALNQQAEGLNVATATNGAVINQATEPASAFAEKTLTVDNNKFQANVQAWEAEAGQQSNELQWQYVAVSAGTEASSDVKLEIQAEYELTPLCFKDHVEDITWLDKVTKTSIGGANWVEEQQSVKIAAVAMTYSPNIQESLETISLPDKVQYRYNLDELLNSTDHQATIELSRSGSQPKQYKVGFCFKTVAQ